MDIIDMQFLQAGYGSLHHSELPSLFHITSFVGTHIILCQPSTRQLGSTGLGQSRMEYHMWQVTAYL